MSNIHQPPRPTSLRSLLERFGHAADGVSAVEFALVLPLMICMFVCLSELAHAVDNHNKVTLLSRTVSDLTAQGDSTDPISQATMDDIVAAARLVMRPFDSTSAQIVVSALGVYNVSGTLRPKVCSSYATGNATKRAAGDPSDLTIPDGFRTAGARYVLTEVKMGYTPMLGTQLVKYLGSTSGQINFAVNTPWPTRGGTKHNSTTEVTLPSGAFCP